MDQVSLEPFAVLGFTTRTDNQREMSGESRIAALWQTYLEKGDRILGVTDPTLTFSLYTNYESDHTGAYDVILGKPVAGWKPSPSLRGIAIPAAQYAVFPAASPTPDAIRAAWLEVYRYFSAQTTLKRAFTIDFERYSPSGVHLYIATR